MGGREVPLRRQSCLLVRALLLWIACNAEIRQKLAEDLTVPFQLHSCLHERLEIQMDLLQRHLEIETAEMRRMMLGSRSCGFSGPDAQVR